jgi:hypothetical protein
MKPMKMDQYSQNLLPMMKKKALSYLRQLLIVPMLILLLPLLVMRAALARTGVLIAIFGLRIAKLAQLEDAWLISDLSAKGKRASSIEMAKVNEAATNAPIRVRTKEHKEFLDANNKETEIVWDTTIEPPADFEPAI